MQKKRTKKKPKHKIQIGFLVSIKEEKVKLNQTLSIY